MDFNQTRHEIWETWRWRVWKFQWLPSSYWSWLRDPAHRWVLWCWALREGNHGEMAAGHNSAGRGKEKQGPRAGWVCPLSPRQMWKGSSSLFAARESSLKTNKSMNNGGTEPHKKVKESHKHGLWRAHHRSIEARPSSVSRWTNVP